MGWRESAAPYGFAQLAAKLGMTTDQLSQRPDLVAAAVAQMEDPKGARHVAESFMDMVDRNGGGAKGLMATIPHYDTMTMATPTTIGSLASGQRNSTIAGLNTSAMAPTVQHLADVTSGRTARVLPEGYTQNFSPAAALVQPIRPGSWNYYSDPNGKKIFAPTWAGDAIAAGKYTTTPSGEYLVPDQGQKPFDVAWSRPTPQTPGMDPNTAEPSPAPAAPTLLAQAAPAGVPSGGAPALPAAPAAAGSPAQGTMDAFASALGGDTTGGGQAGMEDAAMQKFLADSMKRTAETSQKTAAQMLQPVAPRKPDLTQVLALAQQAARPIGSNIGGIGTEGQQYLGLIG
ncbi:MAG: hypothetical protein JSS20_15395 [Proteobacteria bacterium]|nr:hypothetical protein [Pseudomonadota bacterium]